MGSPLRSRFAIACLAALIAVAGVCSPRVRAFAASKLSGIHSTGNGLKQSGPIPYILNLSKHKPHKTTKAKAPVKPAKAKATRQSPRSTPTAEKPTQVPPPAPAR
jgi:hypothetical protein